MATISSATLLMSSLSVSMLCSCEKEAAPDVSDESVFVFENPVEGETLSKELSMGSEWKITNPEKWYMVSPVSGVKGKNQITVTTLESNGSLKERLGEFVLNVGGEITNCKVIQRGRTGLYVPSEEIVFNGAAGNVSFDIEGNVDFTVESAPEWLSFVECTVSEGELLADEVRSLYKTTKLHFTIQANDGENNRTGVVSLSTPDSLYKVNVRQRIQSDIDYDAAFYRRSLGVRFTATWCGYCPQMGEAYEIAMTQSPERLVPMNMHPLSSEGGLGWEGTSEYESYYKTNEVYPIGVINNMAQVRNQGVISKTADIVTGLIGEAVESYPAKTMISATSTMDSQKKVTIRVKLATKEALDYRISAFVLEDGVIFPQYNGGDRYEHNYVVRCRFTEMSGMQVPDVVEDGISEFEISGYVTPNVKDISNAYVVLFVTYPGSPDVKGVINALYQNYGTIVDNAVRLGLDDTVGFRYEE